MNDYGPNVAAVRRLIAHAAELNAAGVSNLLDIEGYERLYRRWRQATVGAELLPVGPVPSNLGCPNAVIRDAPSSAAASGPGDLLERQIAAADRRRSSIRSSRAGCRRSPASARPPRAALTAEIGEPARFDDFDQLLAYAGRAPRRAQLGPQAGRRQVEDERAGPLHAQGAQPGVWGVWRNGRDFDPTWGAEAWRGAMGSDCPAVRI